MESVRQAIHFDLDTKALEIYYPKPSWNHAYEDIEIFFKKHGFIHEQGTGYRSKEPMIQPEALRVVSELIKQHSWLNKCVKICTVYDVPITYDISAMFDKEADIPKRVDIKTEPPCL